MPSQMKRLFLFRTVITALFLSVSGYLLFQSLLPLQQGVFLGSVVAFLISLPFQWWGLKKSSSHIVRLIPQLFIDLILISALVFATNGIESPFVFLFALVIITAAFQAHVLVTLAVTITACTGYLIVVYLDAWHFFYALSIKNTLDLLFQISILMLVGGLMAVIAGRQSRLQEVGDQALLKHKNLQQLHAQCMDITQDGLLVLDSNLRIRDSNHAAETILQTENLHQGIHLTTLFSPSEAMLDFFKVDRKASYQSEIQYGDDILLVTAIRLPAGERHEKWLLSLLNITDLRSLEKQLAMQEKLASLGRMASMLAHEIRNPLQTISQAVELLPDGENEQEREIKRIVQDEIERLKRLVSDILDFTRPAQPSPGKHKTKQLLTSAIRRVDMNGDHAIALDCDDHDLLSVDADHLHLVVDNLLRNALAVSPEANSITVQFSRDDNSWCLEISDHGHGIAAEVQQHLFEPFVSGRRGGLGLGLATVWQLCQANGWKITFDSREAGTSFTIRSETT